jgi:diguanylate cyclase (GGDEF)-like protein
MSGSSAMTLWPILSGIQIVAAVLLGATLWVSSPDRTETDVRLWARGIGSAAVGFAFFAVATLIPEWIAYPLGNAAISISLLLFASAFLDLSPETRPRTWWYVPVIVALVVLSVASQPNLRGFIEAIVVAAQLVYVAHHIYRLAGDEPKPSHRLGAVGGLLCALVLMVRGTTDLLNWPDAAGALTLHSVMTFIASYILGTSWTIAYLMKLKERAETSLREMAMRDPLTGIYNRRTFIDLADAELHRASRHGTPVSLLMVDIDFFKLVNDEYGHLVGDHTLAQVASVITKCLRAEDTFARYGGEEFCVLVAEADDDDAMILAERIRREVDAHPIAVDGHAIRVSVSIGASTRPAQSTQSLDELLVRADAAVYHAKRTGRNRVVPYSDDCLEHRDSSTPRVAALLGMQLPERISTESTSRVS